MAEPRDASGPSIGGGLRVLALVLVAWTALIARLSAQWAEVAVACVVVAGIFLVVGVCNSAPGSSVPEARVVENQDDD